MRVSNIQDHMGQFAEVVLRHKVSGVLQKLLLLLRSAHCCHPAAQWYLSHLWHSRQKLLKVFYNFFYSHDDSHEVRYVYICFGMPV